MKRLGDPTVPLEALKHAIYILRWLGTNQGGDGIVVEMVQQSKECRRELDKALRRFEKREKKP